MTITRRQLDSKYAEWFRGMRHAEEAKREILELFGTEPDEEHSWTEQDFYEQFEARMVQAKQVAAAFCGQE